MCTDPRLPRLAREAIEKLLLHPAVIREELTLEIAFEWSHGQEALRMAMAQSYLLVNVAGQGEQTHELPGSDDVARKTDPQPGRDILISDTPITVGNGHGYKVAVADGSGNFVLTLAEGTSVQLREDAVSRRQSEGREVFRIGLLTVGLKVVITHPENLAPKVVLSCVPDSDERMKAEHRRTEWSFEKDVLLPGHTLMLAWARASTE